MCPNFPWAWVQRPTSQVILECIKLTTEIHHITYPPIFLYTSSSTSSSTSYFPLPLYLPFPGSFLLTLSFRPLCWICIFRDISNTAKNTSMKKCSSINLACQPAILWAPNSWEEQQSSAGWALVWASPALCFHGHCQRGLKAQVYLEVLLSWPGMTPADGEAMALGVGTSSPICFLIWFSTNWTATNPLRPAHHGAKPSVIRTWPNVVLSCLMPLMN